MTDTADFFASRRANRIAKAALAIGLTLFGLWISSTFLPSLLWAAVIAIAIDPLYTRAECRWPAARRAVLPSIATVLIALLVLTPLALGVVEAAREAQALLQWLASARENGLPVPQWVAHMPYSNEIAGWWTQNLATPEAASHQFHTIRQSLLFEQSRLLGKGLIHRSVVFAFTLIALFFLLRERDAFVAQIRVASTRLLGPSAERIGAQVVKSVRGTIDGLVLVGIGEGAVMAVVYLIAHVPHPLLLGLLTAVAAMIPFGAAVLFGIASALLVGQGAVGWAVGVFALGMVVVGIADHFVRPILIGGATRLPFLWVLVGILGGVESLGLLGLFVGPATMAALMMLWRDLIAGAGGAMPAPDRPCPPDAAS
ncbi:AI-2E family transporter [Sphingomonas nostoxanthinifaciens]|uniref:AI-2E family transporter n=1 Tax=Sphingomonas nostoxanthinifaciens TaxID=2872652 RepID=UPI001CC1F869|nr:AI-2E family transporter [Sphingomonas nostoxanthinifaciens]UAK26000.1 AI-2E family transporter [Sphingomonas nostoxanthinifaciens]